MLVADQRAGDLAGRRRRLRRALPARRTRSASTATARSSGPTRPTACPPRCSSTPTGSSRRSSGRRSTKRGRRPRSSRSCRSAAALPEAARPARRPSAAPGQRTAFRWFVDQSRNQVVPEPRQSAGSRMTSRSIASTVARPRGAGLGDLAARFARALAAISSTRPPGRRIFRAAGAATRTRGSPAAVQADRSVGLVAEPVPVTHQPPDRVASTRATAPRSSPRRRPGRTARPSGRPNRAGSRRTR